MPPVDNPPLLISDTGQQQRPFILRLIRNFLIRQLGNRQKLFKPNRPMQLPTTGKRIDINAPQSARCLIPMMEVAEKVKRRPRAVLAAFNVSFGDFRLKTPNAFSYIVCGLIAAVDLDAML